MGEVTGDGPDDIVVTGVDNGVLVIPQTTACGLGAFRRFTVDTSESFIEGLAVGDMTGVGLADVVMAYGGNAPRSRIPVLQANGGVAAPIPYECLVDMNGDGWLAFVVGSHRADVRVA